MISGFCPEVVETCALLGYYTISSDNLLLTFQGNILVPSSGFENPNKACSPSMGFVYGRVWIVKSSTLPASSIVASDWMEGSVVVSVAEQRRSLIEGILTCVIERHRRKVT
jgi:hypothetical protein